MKELSDSRRSKSADTDLLPGPTLPYDSAKVTFFMSQCGVS